MIAPEKPPTHSSNARELADQAEQSSGEDKGDRVEKHAPAKAEDAERESGGVSDDG